MAVEALKNWSSSITPIQEVITMVGRSEETVEN
jgi:hypothetical protein